MNRVFFLCLTILLILIPSNAKAVDGFLIGGQVGYVGLIGNQTAGAGNIGFGLDFGVKANSIMDLDLSFQNSSHNSGFNLSSSYLGADFHVYQFNDVDLIAGFGPGFYFEKLGVTSSYFGLNFGVAADVLLDDHVRIGVGYRYHYIFSTNDYWTTMLRVGYIFTTD